MHDHCLLFSPLSSRVFPHIEAPLQHVYSGGQAVSLYYSNPLLAFVNTKEILGQKHPPENRLRGPVGRQNHLSKPIPVFQGISFSPSDSASFLSLTLVGAAKDNLRTPQLISLIGSRNNIPLLGAIPVWLLVTTKLRLERP